MMILKNTSIKVKLIIIIFLVSFVTSATTLVITIFNKIDTLESDLESKVLLNAKLIGENSVGALDFGQANDARDVLSKLEVLPGFYGFIFDSNNGLMASYPENNANIKEIPRPLINQDIRTEGDYLIVNQPVVYKNQRKGTVVLIALTTPYKQQIYEYLIFAAIVLIVVVILSIILANFLQKYISSPILDLAETTKEVSRKGDYTLRVRKKSNDEIGFLYDEFNEMLDQINIRDAQRNRAQEILKNSEDRLLKAQEIAKVGSWVYDPVIGKVIWSEEMYKIFGIDPANPLKLSFLFEESLISDDLFKLKQMEKDAEKPQFFEYKIIRPDGELRYIRAGGNFLIAETGDTYKIGVVQDITEQKEADLLILLSKQRYENIFNLVPVSIWEEDYLDLKNYWDKLLLNGVSDLNEYIEKNPSSLFEMLTKIQILDVNEASLRLFEAGSKEELLRNFNKTFTASSLDVFRNIIIDLYNGETNIEKETEFVTLRGRRIDAIIRMSVFASQNIRSRVLISIFDISALKRLDKEKEKLLVEITQKNSELEQIIYVSSHDLRSPLVNIQGFGKELEMSITDLQTFIEEENDISVLKSSISDIIKNDIPASLKFIRSSAIKMDGLLKGLLRISRLGRALLNIEQIDMNQLLVRITDAMQFQIQQAKVDLEIKDLPPCSGDLMQVNQLFTNILDNAIKYLDVKKSAEIKIGGEIIGDKVRYYIQDNGIGFNTAHKEKIFEIFHRLNPDSGVPGEGLGLAIVKRIVQRHNGSINIISKEGEGSTFFIELPKI